MSLQKGFIFCRGFLILRMLIQLSGVIKAIPGRKAFSLRLHLPEYPQIALRIVDLHLAVPDNDVGVHDLS